MLERESAQPIEMDHTGGPQTSEEKPSTLRDDPDYQKIKEGLNQRWLETTGVTTLSGDHQDYVFGDPANRDASTLAQDAEAMFRDQFAERASAYDENERVRAYDSITDDPAYQAIQERITVRTNIDDDVRRAKGSLGSGGMWERVYRREHIHGMIDFARQYPEKAGVYADRWNAFVEAHPDVNGMNNAQWDAWSREHPHDALSMSEYRNVARGVSHVERKKKMQMTQPRVQESNAALAEVRKSLGLQEPSSAEEETPLAQEQEHLRELQLEEVVSAIQTDIPAEIQSADRERLEALQKELAELPYISDAYTHELLSGDGEDEGVMMVDTDAIVGSVSPAFKNWSTEYDNRKGRAVDVAEELLTGTPEAVEHVFHLSDPEQGIQLKRIEGPGGDLFFVADGSHRVSGSKLIELAEIPARVEKMNDLSEVRTSDPLLKSQWEQRIKRGLIRGSITEAEGASGESQFTLNIDAQVLPWMNLSQPKLVQMTKVYAERYPEALDSMTSLTTGEEIPKEALLDEVAMNYYLADRWSEYQPAS